MTEFEIVDRAGLSRYEFAYVMGVTPATVYGWIKGRSPSKHLKPKVDTALVRFGKWVDAGKLPRNAANKEERLAILDRIRANLNK